jgi:hypothetical protein
MKIRVKIVKTLFPKLYWDIVNSEEENRLKNEFEMQAIEKKYSNVSHGLREYKYCNETYLVHTEFIPSEF